jgi:hypothetical protein
MSDPTDLQKDIAQLTADLKRLEAEYSMFFAGRLPRPPWETRSRVESLIKRWDRRHIPGTADRFRFEMVQSRFQTMIDVWDRGQRAREEGRAGPFAAPPSAPTRAARGAEPAAGRVLHVAALKDPLREMDKVHALYDSLMAARRSSGEGVVPFHRFAALVSDQVSKLRASGTAEVAFRVAVQDGKVKLTVRGPKGGGS